MAMGYIKANNKELFVNSQPILLRGFGLGGWLLPEGYMWKFYTKCDRPRRIEKLISDLCGDRYAQYFWEEYYKKYITKQDIALIAQQGFNSVRLPINARHYHQVVHLIDALVEWCREYGVYIILDMHGAPGGQTGQNIDDSENDTPELFIQSTYQDELISLWKDIAQRYAHEPIIAGYDLLNEPLPKWWNQYYDKLMPLYQDIIRAIRQVDQEHLIILEGVHWSTDFSIFRNWDSMIDDPNIMVQFHKYWSSPDKESLKEFLDTRERQNLPLFMGEGGENNLDWYISAFPLYEQLNISWSFWTYKKIDNTNSPISFTIPQGWDRILAYLDHGEPLHEKEARAIFDSLIDSIAHPVINWNVFYALKRVPPITMPSTCYSAYSVKQTRPKGAQIHENDPVNIQFVDGHIGVPDYRRYGGEEQPDTEQLVVILQPEEWIEYQFNIESDGAYDVIIKAYYEGVVGITCSKYEKLFSSQEYPIIQLNSLALNNGAYTVRILCREGMVLIRSLEINVP